MSRMDWNRPRVQHGREDINPLARRAEAAEWAWKNGGRFVGVDRAIGADRTVEISGTVSNGVQHVEAIRETMHATAVEAREQLRGVTAATVHCDGACWQRLDEGLRGSHGPGGWGLLIDSHTVPRIELCGGAASTTNNRMEMIAAMTALRVLPAECAVLIITDSQYLVKGATVWLTKWRRKGFKRRGVDQPNADLWRKLDALATGRPLTWQWVKGHNGHRDNDRADQLATMGLRQHIEA